MRGEEKKRKLRISYVVVYSMRRERTQFSIMYAVYCVQELCNKDATELQQLCGSLLHENFDYVRRFLLLVYEALRPAASV
jgi:hypothetical protein